MSLLVSFQMNWSRDGLCMACTNVLVSQKANLRGMIWGQVNLENVSKHGKPPIKQSKTQYPHMKFGMHCFSES
jgi:hypothetical protein